MGREQREPWELAAEELVRHVRSLLDGHWSAIEDALRQSLSKDQARSHLRQLDHFAHVLEIELWRKGTTPDKTIGRSAASGLKTAITAVITTAATLATTAAYEDLTEAETKADHVVECVIREEGVAAGMLGWSGVLADDVTDAGGRWGTGKSTATGDVVASVLRGLNVGDGGDQDDTGPPTPSSPPPSEAARVPREDRVEVQVGPTRKAGVDVQVGPTRRVDSSSDHLSSMRRLDEDDLLPSTLSRLFGMRWNSDRQAWQRQPSWQRKTLWRRPARRPSPRRRRALSQAIA